MVEWFIYWQTRILGFFGSVCVLILFLFDFRGFQSLLLFLVSIALILSGNQLFTGDTSENWLKISYAEMTKNTLGGVLMLFGWMIFLRGVFAVTMAALILKMG